MSESGGGVGGHLLPVINKLHDVFTAVGGGCDPVDLPRIVVIGSQSSGKSSVLEGLVGRDFLPRGSGIVTRRPLVLQLVRTAAGSKEGDWAEFVHRPGQRYTDFGAVRDEISGETARLTGPRKGVSRQPIGLRVHSAGVVDLTLVDLPGITRVPVDDQPLDIESVVRGMALEYISKPNSIILAVTAANTDLSTSDAMQLARQVDPAGMRTLGVITKLDLMDRGTDALAVLANEAIPLRLGFVGVVCRSQQDIDAGKPMARAVADEARFFESHPRYRTIASRCGTPYLARTLSSLLLGHIRKSLPELKLRVAHMLSESRAELAACGGPGIAAGKSPEALGATLLQLITKFAADYVAAVQGSTGEDSEVSGGARLRNVFENVFGRQVEAMEPLEGLSPKEIRTVIKNAAGARPSLFVPEAAFDVLVKRQVARLEDPGLECVDFVYDEMHRVLDQVQRRVLGNYPKLREAVADVVHTLLGNNRTPAREMVSNLVLIELSFVNTAHPDFIGGDRAIALVNERIARESSMGGAAAGGMLQVPSIPGLASPSNVRCFLCDELLPNDPKVINAHIDVCLSRQGNGGSPSASSASAKHHHHPSKDPQQQQQQTPQGGGFFSGLFGGGSGAKRAPSTTQSALPASMAAAPIPTQSPTPGNPDAPQPAAQRGRKPANEAAAAAAAAAPAAAAAAAAAPPASEIPAAMKPAMRERFETELVRVLLESYFALVKKNVKDSVPKACMHFLVRNTLENLQSQLVQSLYREGRLDALLAESPEVVSRREACLRMIEVLQRATEIIHEVRDDTLVQ